MGTLRTHRDLDVWKEGIELETQLIIADGLGFLSDRDVFPLIEKEKSKPLGLIKYLRGDKDVQKP